MGLRDLATFVKNNNFSTEKTPFFSLKAGQSATVLFNNEQGDPYISLEHTIKEGKSFSTIPCRRDKGSCIMCAALAQEDERISKPSNRVYFNVIDFRESDPEKAQKRMVLSSRAVSALSASFAQVKGKCKSCGKGKIKVVGYLDEQGQKIEYVMDDPPEQWTEVLGCSRCKEPVRMNLIDVPFQITRTGDGTNTTYAFLPLYDEDLPGWISKCVPVDLKKTIFNPKDEWIITKFNLKVSGRRVTEEEDDYLSGDADIYS